MRSDGSLIELTNEHHAACPFFGNLEIVPATALRLQIATPALLVFQNVLVDSTRRTIAPQLRWRKYWSIQGPCSSAYMMLSSCLGFKIVPNLPPDSSGTKELYGRSKKKAR